MIAQGHSKSFRVWAASLFTMVALILSPITTALNKLAAISWHLLQSTMLALMETQAWESVLHIFTEYRAVVIVGIVLPLSFIFDQFFTFRNWIVRTFLLQPKLHEQRVREVQDSVLRWNEDGRSKPMCTARAEWLTMSTRTATFKEDCSRITIDLHDILELDIERQIVSVEPLVDMGQITRHLLPLGWTLAVMVEMEDLTVGGLLMGVGVENNSHIYGALSETVESYEVVLGDGSLVRASKSENVDLYHALPWSHGTLGFLVSAELKIVPAKPYMHIRYIPCYSLDEIEEKVTTYCNAETPPSFFEMTVYSKETAVIMIGEFADKPSSAIEFAKINRVNLWFKPWFYKHVKGFLDIGESDEFVPLRHWFHRHTRSIFWYMEELVPFGDQWWYRWFFAWLGAPKIAFLKWTTTPKIREESVYYNVFQDILVPMTEIKSAISLADGLFDIYPMLFYPVKFFSHPSGCEGFIRNVPSPIKGSNPPAQLFFDLGVYGIPPIVKKGGKFEAEKNMRSFEHYTRSVGGYQLMYADTFMCEEEFKEMFDHTLYNKCREKYRATGAFPTVWDKVKGQFSGCAIAKSAPKTNQKLITHK